MKSYILKTIKTYYVLIILIICGIIGYTANKSHSGVSSSSMSSDEHKCGSCNTSFTGHGWSTAGGEQFQQSSWSGYGYCSKKCAYDSQPSRWKN